MSRYGRGRFAGVHEPRNCDAEFLREREQEAERAHREDVIETAEKIVIAVAGGVGEKGTDCILALRDDVIATAFMLAERFHDTAREYRKAGN